MFRILVLIGLLMVPAVGFGAETLDLTAPVVKPSNTGYTVDELRLNWGKERILVVLRGSNGEQVHFSYHGAEATTLMQGLNKANLSANSLHKRILDRLVSDGKLVGTVSGTPD